MQVVADTKKMLNIPRALVFRTPFNRSNLFYEVRHKSNNFNHVMDDIAHTIQKNFTNQSGKAIRCRCCLEGHLFWFRHKQNWGRGFILLPQAAILPSLDAGSDVVEPASGFVIQNRQTSCSMWCPMYEARI